MLRQSGQLSPVLSKSLRIPQGRDIWGERLGVELFKLVNSFLVGIWERQLRTRLYLEQFSPGHPVVRVHA